MSFRPADWSDRAVLYRWRQAEEAKPWYGGRPSTEQEHADWLKKRLDDPLVRILIWQENGEPCGVARRDSNDELTFYATTDDAAVRLLAEIVGNAADTKRIKATLDVGDPRVGLLKAAGFTEYPSVSLIYKPCRCVEAGGLFARNLGCPVHSS